MMTKIIQHIFLALGIGIIFLTGGNYAAASTSNATVTVKGNVLMPPCIINGGNDINVDFGDEVMTTRVSEGIYRKQVYANISCDGSTMVSSLLQIRIEGTGSSFDPGILQTTKSGLGVQFQNGSSALALNSGLISFDYESMTPTIWAMLATDPAEKLTGGYFSGTATMTVEYQ